MTTSRGSKAEAKILTSLTSAPDAVWSVFTSCSFVAKALGIGRQGPQDVDEASPQKNHVFVAEHLASEGRQVEAAPRQEHVTGTRFRQAAMPVGDTVQWRLGHASGANRVARQHFTPQVVGNDHVVGRLFGEEIPWRIAVQINVVLFQDARFLFAV